MSEAEKMAERLEKREFPPGSSMFGEYDFLVRLCKEAATLIRRLQAENEDFLEQITVQTESVLFKELQETIARNNALFAENVALREREVT
jgi:hypothetical protein